MTEKDTFILELQVNGSQAMQQLDELRKHIEAIRRYKAAYPKGAKSLLRYAQELFDNLIDQ